MICVRPTRPAISSTVTLTVAGAIYVPVSFDDSTEVRNRSSPPCARPRERWSPDSRRCRRRSVSDGAFSNNVRLRERRRSGTSHLRKLSPTPMANDGPECQVTGTGPVTGHHPRSRRRLRLPQSSILHDRRRTSSHHAHQRIRAMSPRAMKRAMKSAPLIGQINGTRTGSLPNIPDFLGAPGRIRTCAPASGGRLSGTSWPPSPALPTIQRTSDPRIPSGRHVFIPRTIPRGETQRGVRRRGSRHLALRWRPRWRSPWRRYTVV
jgi:hypothetical protein